MAAMADLPEDLSSLSESELTSYLESLRLAFEQKGLEWPVAGSAPTKIVRQRSRDDDDGEEEEEEDEDEDEREDDGDTVSSLERNADKVCFDFRLGELPRGVEHEGQPARLMRTADSGDATILSVPPGGYMRLPLDFSEKHGATVTQYTLVVELRCSHPRPLSLFQATWPEVSANHPTISECIVDDGRLLVGGAESETMRSLATARQQNRFIRLFYVCDAKEGQIEVYVNADLALRVNNVQQSRFQLDRKGLLLLASNSASYMPGNVELKRVELHRRLMNSQDIKAHASQRWSFRGAALSSALRQLRGKLSLCALDKKPQPVWCDLSFLAHFCDVFMNINNGSIYRSLQVVHLGLEKLIAEKNPLMSADDQAAAKKACGIFESGLDLFRKYDRTKGEVDPYDDYAEMPGLLPFLKRLRRALTGLEVGAMCLLPGGWGCGDFMARQYISLVLERVGEDNYRIAVFGFGDSREYHPKTAQMTPKVKFRPIVLENLSRKKALDDAWWALLIATNLPDVNEQKTNPQLTYDFFLPFMAGQTLEQLREASEKRSDDDDPALDWRTPVYGRSRNNFHRCLLDALHYILRRSGLSKVRTKVVKFCLRTSLLKLASNDVKAVLELSGSDRTLVRMLCKQLAFTAAKLSKAGYLGLDGLRQVRQTVDEVEIKLLQKTSSEGTSEKPPLLDLSTGEGGSHVAMGKAASLKAPDAATGIFPLFERLLREELEGKEGSALDTSQLPPVNFDLLTSKVRSMNDAVAALKATDLLLAQLDNLSSSLRFAHFLKIALVQHVFTRLLPVPLGPLSRLRGGDTVWGGAATPEQQVDTALVVKRIAQHFAMSCGATAGHRGFDGTRVIVLGAMVTLMDRLLRQELMTTTSRAVAGRMDDERDNEETRFLVSWEVFAKQSETFLLFSPDLNVARARTLAYFQEVEQEAREQGAKIKHIFQWERDGWVMEYPDQGAEALCGKMAKSLYKRRTSLIDTYIDSYFPEFAAFRDVCMWWKFYLCTDPIVFRFQPLEFSDGHLQWAIDVHPRWQKRCYIVKSFGQGNQARMLFQKLEKPAMKEHRFQSEALPSNLAGQSIWSEDDVLHVHTMPSFGDRLGQADSELLLSYLTVPYLRLPLCLGYFSTEDRVHALSQSQLRDVLQAVVFEPGRFLPSRLYGQVPQLVPAEDPELLGTAFGLLTNELARSPEATIDAVLQLLEQALLLDTQDPHASTTAIIFSVLRLCCRVQNTMAFLLSVSRAEHPSCSTEGLNEGGRPVLSEQTLRQLQAAWPRMRNALQAVEAGGRSALMMLQRWLGLVRTDFGEKVAEEQEKQALKKGEEEDEAPDFVISGAGEERANGEYICEYRSEASSFYGKKGDDSVFIDSFCGQWIIYARYQGVLYEGSGSASNPPKIWKARSGKEPMPVLESVVDRETQLACQIHGHRVLLLRNLRAEDLNTELVEQLLCSFVFLTSRHTWNEDTLGMPEPELFEVIFEKRLELIAWLEQAPYEDACHVLNAVLRTATGIEPGPPAWAIWPEASNRGRYVAISQKLTSVDGRLPMAGTFGDTMPAAEVNLQSLVFRVEGQQMQALDERAAQDPDVLHIFGASAKTLQCVSLGDFEHRQDRKVVGTDYVISMWDGEQGGLPEIGLCDRIYDPDDLAAEEQWIADFFEPIRKKYFTKLGMPPADVQFYLPEQTVPEDAHMVLLAGGHPKKSSTIWKEVVIYKDFGCCQVFGIEACGRRKYRILEMSTDARFCHWEMQPESSILPYNEMMVNTRPREPWPVWGRHLAVAFGGRDLDNCEDDYRDYLRGLQPPPFGPSVVIQRPVQSVRGKPTATAEETEARVKATAEGKTKDARKPPVKKGAWDRPECQDLEEYIPAYLLRGLIPAALLASHDFWQDTGESCRLTGYGTSEVSVELLPRATIIGVGLEGAFNSTDEPAACARITMDLAGANGDLEPHLLLNLISAPKGTPLHSMARWASRLDDLSHVLAWGRCADADTSKQTWACAPLRILQFPRLGLTFFVKDEGGVKRLVSADFGNLSVPLAPVPEQVAKLLTGIPHAVILCDEMQSLHVLVPQYMPLRPNIKGRPFTTEIVFERLGKWGRNWTSKAKVTYFKYEVHVSKGFLIAPSFSSAMYLLLLRFLARDYEGVSSLVHAVGTDAELNEEEAQILKVLGLVEDAHPDALACRCLVTLAVLRSGCPLPWDFWQEFAWYVSKISHISARSRLSLDQEAELLNECERLSSKFRVTEAQTKKLKGRERGVILDLLLDPERAKAAAASEMQKLQDLKNDIFSAMRAEGLSCNEAEMRRLVSTINQRAHTLPDWMSNGLSNRQELLKARGCLKDSKDKGKEKKKDKEKKGKEEKEEVTLKLPKPTDDARAKWIVHCNRNVLKDSMVSSASFEECSIKTYAMRPALEWALINLHGDSSLEDMFMLLYRLFTGHTKLKLGPPGTAEEDTRRWAHTFATLVAYLKPETMEHGFLASFINVFAHNFDELWTSDGQSALPKPPGNELGRSQSRELVHERFLTELRSWILDHKERLVWPSGGDEDDEGGGDNEEEDEEDENADEEAEEEEEAEEGDKEKEGEDGEEGDEEESTETFKTKVILSSRADLQELLLRLSVKSKSLALEAPTLGLPAKSKLQLRSGALRGAFAHRPSMQKVLPSEALEEITKFESFPVTLVFQVPKVALVYLPNAADAALLLSKLKEKELILLQPMSLGGVGLRRGATLQLKKGLKMEGDVKDGIAEARTRISGFTDFPVELVFELPEEETAEEKPNMGLVKLKDLPAVDGYSSHGMFAREGRIPEPSNFSYERRSGKARPVPSNLEGVWSDVGRLINKFSEDLGQLLGQLLPNEMVSKILEKKPPLTGAALPPGELPFDISKHPSCRHAEKSLSRWSEDMAFFRERAAGTTQYMLKLKAGGEWPALDALSGLHDQISQLKESDEAAVAQALTVLLKAAGHVDDSTSEECLRFSLLRYCGQEPEVWFEFLFGSFLSGRQQEDWRTVNPFLKEQELQLLSDLASLVMLRASRLGVLSRSLEELNRVRVQVQALEGGASLEQRRLLLSQASATLAQTLRSKRAYAPSDLEGSYDPRFLAFEFTRNLLLRDNQVSLVQDFITTLTSEGGSNAMVKQMIMGQGKTTVVCPMLVLMLANGEQLVVLVVPSALLDMSRRVLRSTFASVLTKKVGTFECERSSPFDPHLLNKLEKAKSSGAAVVTVPTSVKSLMLRMVELMFKLQAKGKDSDTSVTETRSQVRQLSEALTLFRNGAVLMDEVDVVLHPLKSELNFPYGPKEPLDGSSPRAFRWTLPMHLFEALFLAQAVLKNRGRLPSQAEAQLSGAQGTRYKEIAVGLSKRLAQGYAMKALQASPHLVLLEDAFFEEELKPLLTEWLILWLRSQGVMDSRGTAKRLRTGTVSSYLMRASDEAANAEQEAAFKNLPSADMKMLNLAHSWLSLLLPHCLAKIDRVSFGIMTTEDLSRALEVDPNMPLSRGKLAIPFIGKDVPSPTNEFAHPDIVIGLTILGYRYEQLRLTDIDEVMVRLLNDVRKEPGRPQDRPSAVLYRGWVTDAGGFLCDPSVPDEDKEKPKKGGVPPLALVQRSNEQQMKDIFKLLRASTAVIQWYLEQLVFPKYMRFQNKKLSASGQELGAEMLFARRVGFSGTPTELLPKGLGRCHFAPGDDAAMFTTLTDPGVMALKQMDGAWTVNSLLENVIAEDAEALIDTGALITGMSNMEVAQFLASHKDFKKQAVVYLNEADAKMVYVRKTKSSMKLEDCGIPLSERFAFYDQVHTTGMDIQHKPDARAVLTLGKDMVWRDYCQGAYRMRGINKGQRLVVYAIPEVSKLIEKSLMDVPISNDNRVGLVRVVAWLVINGLRSERVQAGMLRSQDSHTLWRRPAFNWLQEHSEEAQTEEAKKHLDIFEEPLDLDLASSIPKPKSLAEAIEERAKDKEWLLGKEDLAELKRLMGVSAEAEQVTVSTADQEQQQEQEQEQEQEIEIEKFADLGFQRDNERPYPWSFDLLTKGQEAAVGLDRERPFYQAKHFQLYKKQPLSFPDDLLLTRNYFNRYWSGHRRLKNAVMMLEWIPRLGDLRESRHAEAWSHEEEAQLLEIWQILTKDAAKEDSQIQRASGQIDGGMLKDLQSALHGLPEPSSHAAFLADLANHGGELPSEAGRLAKAKVGFACFRSLLGAHRWPATEAGRLYILLSLAEAETVRKVMHARASEKPEGYALSLRAVGQGTGRTLDSTAGPFPEPMDHQLLMAMQAARFLDCQTYFEDHCIPLILRGLMRDAAFRRRKWFEAAQSCRRRFGRWQEQPVAEVLTLDSDLSFLEEASLSVTLREALSGKNLSIRAAFDIFDADKNGSLDMVETWAALYHLGLRGISADQVVRFFDIMDEAKVGRVGFTEFHNFVEAAVQEKSHHIRLEESKPEKGTLALPPAPIALRRIISSESPVAHGMPPLFRQTSPTVPEDGALQLPMQPPDLARLTSAAPGAPGAPVLGRGGTVPPQLGRHSSFQATSTLFSEPRFKEELELAKSTFAEQQREKEASHEQLYSRELKVIEEKHEEEEERIMGTNPSLSEAGDAAEWSFQRSRLPRGSQTVPQYRCDFEIDPDSLVPDRKRCILQAGASLELHLPRGLVTSSAHRPALEAYSLTLFLQLPTDWAPTSGQVTPLLEFPRAEEAMWGETSAQLVLLHDGTLALRSTGDEDFKISAKKEEEEIEKKKQAQKDLEKKRKEAIKAAKKAKLKKETSDAEKKEKAEAEEAKEAKEAEEESKEEGKKEEKKEAEPTDFRFSPSVGTWFTGLPGKDETKGSTGDVESKDDNKDPTYDSWWPPHGCRVAKEASADAPKGAMACEAKVVKAGQWNLLTLVVQCASSCLPEERFVTAYLNGEAAFHLTSHPALEEALAVDLHGGMRLLPPSSSSIAMPGCQLRSLELRCRALPLDEVLEAQVPRGVWKCNKCKRYNPPAKRLEKPLCYCGVVRPSSAARPKDDKDDEHPGLTVVVADSFQELVIDSERHVFLDVYADWCGPCLQAKPHFHKLAALLRACDDIGICGYDADANEKPTKYIPESTIPVFKLFVRGDKQNPISFKGERTLRGFLAFLKQHTKLDIQDALRLLYADYCFQNDIEDLYRYFLASLAAQLDKNHQLPSHLLRWAEQYFLDPDRFYPVKDSDDAWQVAKKDVPSSLLPEALRPLQPGTKVRVTKDEATLERTQRQVMGFIHNRCARKELLGQVGTVVVAESHRTEVQVQFSPELVAPMRSERRYGHHAREIERLEKQGIVMLHRQALEIEAEAVSAAPRRKSKWIEVWEKVPAVEKDRLHEVVVRMDLQLMNAQPSDPRSYLIHAITDGNPLTTSTVYPRFLSEPCPERVAVKAPKPLGKQEANEAWTDLEKALFLPDIFGQLGSGGDESRLQLVKQLLIRGLQPDFSFRGRPLLHRACESGDLALAELLFACGADLHARGGDENSLPIEVAAWCGQMQLLRLLVINGSCFGQALHMAALSGHLEAAQLLLNYGCPPHVRIAGVTPLDLAIAACQAPIVTLLLQDPTLTEVAGAEEKLHPQAISRYGLAPRSRRLHLVTKMGGPRGAILKSLLSQGGLGKQKEWWAILEAEDGMTPLTVAQLPTKLLLRPNCLEVWSTLLQHFGQKDDLAALRQVLESKGDPNCANAAGWTPLILSAMADRGDLCELLLQFGADPFQAGPRGRSALLWADWYQASRSLAVLKADRREKRDDREGLKRLQQALKDEFASPIVTPMAAADLPTAMNFPGRSFSELVELQLARQAELWEPGAGGAQGAQGVSKLWSGEGDAETGLAPLPLQDILSEVNLPGPIGDFDGMKSLVQAARLLVQAKIAAGAPAESATGALAFYVLTLLDAKSRERVNSDLTQAWVQSLLRSTALAWHQLPAERSVVFRAVRLKGDLSAYRRQLELFAPRRPVAWPCPTYGTLDRRVALAYLEDWKEAVLVFKIFCLTARRINEFSWLAAEDQTSALHESMIAPGTQFESCGVFELSDVTMRRDVPMDASLRQDFEIHEEVQLLPSGEIPRQALVILQEVVPAEDLRKASESASAAVRTKKTATYL